MVAHGNCLLMGKRAVFDAFCPSSLTMKSPQFGLERTLVAQGKVAGSPRGPERHGGGRKREVPASTPACVPFKVGIDPPTPLSRGGMEKSLDTPQGPAYLLITAFLKNLSNQFFTA